jgi:hypothetical protein
MIFLKTTLCTSQNLIWHSDGQGHNLQVAWILHESDFVLSSNNACQISRAYESPMNEVTFSTGKAPMKSKDKNL